MLTPYHPRCSIPYINLDEFPGREKENEENKVNYGWKPGDGYLSIRSKDEIGAYFGNIKRFKIYQNKFPDAKLEDGSCEKEGLNPLCFAARVLRAKVCEHIINIGGKHLLEIGSCQNGDTPLLFATKYSSNVQLLWENHYETVKILLDLGANPNMANAAGETPLFHAAENNNNVRLLMLLLLNGAVANPPCSSLGKARTAEALQELFNLAGIKELFLAKRNKNSAFNIMPDDVVNEIVIKLIAEIKNTLSYR